jgi:hypothetical protein
MQYLPFKGRLLIDGVNRNEDTMGHCSLRNKTHFITGHSNFSPCISLGLSTNNNHTDHTAPYTVALIKNFQITQVYPIINRLT